MGLSRNGGGEVPDAGRNPTPWQDATAAHRLAEALDLLWRGEPLSPRLKEEHRRLLLQRAATLCYVGPPIYLFTILLYDYLYHADVFSGGLVASVPPSVALLLLRLTLRTRFMQRHYNLPLFLILGVFSNYAETVNLQLTGGGEGGFFFPYFLIYFTLAVYYQGTFPWVLAAAALLIFGYAGSEWALGRDFASSRVATHVIYLADAAVISLVGQRIVYTWFLRDKKSQIEIEEANARLKELDQAKSTFFANVSHELKTPMTLILGPLEMAHGDAPPDTESVPFPRRTFLSILQNSYRLSGLISDLLDLTRSEMKKTRLRAVIVSRPAEYFRGVLTSLGALMEERELCSELEVPPHLLPHRLDVEKIDKVLVNLVSNAAKFTPKGGMVRARLWDEPAPGAPGPPALMISVRDTGIGIPADKLPHIFERFMQVDPSSTRAYGGMGIGLSLVKDFVELHGGSVQVASRVRSSIAARSAPPAGASAIAHGPAPSPEFNPGPSTAHGTEVTVALPRRSEDLVTASSVRVAAGAEENKLQRQVWALRPSVMAGMPTAAAGPSGARTLLLVDDSPQMLAMLQDVLHEYRTVVTGDGEEALRVARETPPDLIVSDIMMPKMDGYSLVRELRGDPALKGIPILLLTAKSGEEDLCLGFSSGADDYVMKPFGPRELRARVANLLRIQSQKRALEEANQKLRETQSELVLAEKLSAVGILAGGMAHELNNPVGAVRNYVQDLLEDTSPEDPRWERLKKMEMATARCRRLVSDLLTFARQNQQLEQADVNEVVAATLADARRESAKEGVSLNAHFGRDLPKIRMDRAQIRQVLMNLIMNAQDAIQGKGEIAVRTRQEGPRVLIQVSDTGVGIPPDIRSKLFDPFFTTKVNGRGLGLAMSYDLVKRHNGDISVESRPGRGSTFCVFLPT